VVFYCDTLHNTTCTCLPRRVDSRDMSCTGEMMETVDNLCGILINADGPFAECIESMVRSIFIKPKNQCL